MNEEVSYIYLLSVFSLLISLLFLTGVKSNNRYYSFVCLMASYEIFTSEALPGIYWFLFGNEPNYFLYLRPWAWVSGYIASIVYWLVFFFSLKLIESNSILISVISKKILFRFRDPLITRNIFLFVYFLSFLGAVIFISEDAKLRGYASAGSSLTSSSISETNLIRPFSTLFVPLATALIYFLIKEKENRKNTITKIQLYFVLFLFFCKIIFDITQGGRGTILMVGISLCFVAWVSYGKTVAISFILVAGLIGSILSPIIYVYRNDAASYYGLGVIDRIQIFLDKQEDTKGSFDQASEYERIAYRFDGIPNGGNLILYTLETENIYFNQYINNLYALIPRAFWSDKPKPGSADGDSSTTSNAITGKISGRPWLLTSVSPSSIAFWQFNFIGLLIVPYIQALLVRVMIKLGDHYNRGELFAFFYFILNPFGSLDAFFLQILQWILPLIILYWLIDNTFYRKKKQLINVLR